MTVVGELPRGRLSTGGEVMEVSDEVCEHCLIGITIESLWGPFQVYECELDQYRNKEWSAGFEEPCEGHRCKTDTSQGRAGNRC